VFFRQPFSYLSNFFNYSIFIHCLIPPLILLECRSPACYILVYCRLLIPYE
jgi:hypothetical protein